MAKENQVALEHILKIFWYFLKPIKKKKKERDTDV